MLKFKRLASKSRRISLSLMFCLLSAGSAYATDWEPVEDPALQQELFSDTLMQATLKDGDPQRPKQQITRDVQPIVRFEDAAKPHKQQGEE